MGYRHSYAALMQELIKLRKEKKAIMELLDHGWKYEKGRFYVHLGYQIEGKPFNKIVELSIEPKLNEEWCVKEYFYSMLSHSRLNSMGSCDCKYIWTALTKANKTMKEIMSGIAYCKQKFFKCEEGPEDNCIGVPSSLAKATDDLLNGKYEEVGSFVG